MRRIVRYPWLLSAGLALGACSDPTSAKPGSGDAQVERPPSELPTSLQLAQGEEVSLAGLPKELARCLHEDCAGLPAASFATCQARCEGERWSVTPTSLRYDPGSGQLTVTASVRHDPGQVDGSEVVREREAYVGITAVTHDGREIDLAIQTLFPGRLTSEVMFMASPGPEVQDIIFGVWDRKVTPCDDARSGCQKYGFLLDGSLATWPPQIYADGRRQRILPAEVRLQPRYAGGTAREFGRALGRITAALEQRAAPFHAAVLVEPTKLARMGRDDIQLAYRHVHDTYVGGQVAGALPKLKAVHDSGITADFAVRIGSPSSDGWSCAQEHCAEAQDLLQCIAQSCEREDP